jgi:hypothetical protein
MCTSAPGYVGAATALQRLDYKRRLADISNLEQPERFTESVLRFLSG